MSGRDGKKNVFVGSRYSLSFAVWFSGMTMVFFGLLGGALSVTLDKRLGVDYLADIMTLSRLQEKLPLILSVTAVVQAVVGSFVILILALFWAHAVAGPLARFRKYLRMAGRHEPTGEMSFRKGDQLHYLSETFRKMQDRRTKRENQIFLYGQRVKGLIAEYESLVKDPRGNSTALEEKRVALKEIYKNILTLLPEEKHS